jgi:nucleotide-binding universal stress UspA family protein
LPERRIKEDLAALVTDFPAARLRLHVSEGKPGPDIVEFANRLGSELLVMGTHARHGLRHWMVGGVCEWVLHHCPCPILVCRGPEPA